MRFTRRFAARIVFYAGLLLMLLGVVFLLGAIAGVSRLPLLSSCLFLIIGCLFAIIATKISKKPVYLFFASFFFLVGLFFLVSGLHIIPLTLPRLWPMLSVFAGFALVPAGWRHFRAMRIQYLIPSLAFITLGFSLLPFSLKLVSFSFKRFIIDWWPLCMVLAGLVLVLLSFGTNKKNGE
ncbi:MAG: hypothetical protein LBI67_01865 [Treponema sp.]|jgi:hypothetical protein|nr:hypothetical protein [Treponema sp.]